ncbi:MAG: NAD(P)/FAD-dependent oxidoreductase, partial [Campylobacterales bacterium]|nr:NAD(P)/FAD-dependent oxidoreductase [Campylobacterales bacterium]
FGGATTAKYIKKFSPETEVILINEKEHHHTCPFGNTVIAGLNKIDYIKHGYKTLEKKYGINMIYQKAKKVDGDAKVVILENGDKIPYHKAVVAPGIDFKYEKGYTKEAEKHSPHAIIAGEQTEILHKQLTEMKDGGTYVMVAPALPFRCPPGPYERISLVAHYLKNNKPNSKIIILDQKNEFSKEKLFKQGWDELYPDMIEWRGDEFGGKVLSVDPVKKILVTEDEEVQADVLNYIPNQKAAQIAFDSGLVRNDWCPVNRLTFESTLVKDVYVIGDAALATRMPKSGFSANSQGKIAALQITRTLYGKPIVTPPKLANTCYSLLAPDYGITVAAVYEAFEDEIKKVEGSGGLSPMKASKEYRLLEAQYAVGWYQNQTADVFR